MEKLSGDSFLRKPGAAPDSWFSHLTVEVPAPGGSNEWLEPVQQAEIKEAKAMKKVTAGSSHTAFCAGKAKAGAAFRIEKEI